MQSLLCVANGPGAKPRGTTNGIRSEVRLSAGQRAVNGGSRRTPPDLLLQPLDALGGAAHQLIDLLGGGGQPAGARGGPPAPRDGPAPGAPACGGRRPTPAAAR